MTKILIIEDEQSFIDLLTKGLSEEGFDVISANNGIDGLAHIKNNPDINLAIVDVMIPGLTGFELVKEVRKSNQSIPLLMLTAKDDVTSKIRGFESGCDDYLTKPFSFDELSVRINALLRRSGLVNKSGAQENKINEIKFLNYRLDLNLHQVFYNDQEVLLTKTEFDIFHYLLQLKNMVISRQQILENVRGYTFDTSTNIVDVHIRSLRKKLKKKLPTDNKIPEPESIIKTVRGVGYVIRG